MALEERRLIIYILYYFIIVEIWALMFQRNALLFKHFRASTLTQMTWRANGRKDSKNRNESKIER